MLGGFYLFILVLHSAPSSFVYVSVSPPIPRLPTFFFPVAKPVLQ